MRNANINNNFMASEKPMSVETVIAEFSNVFPNKSIGLEQENMVEKIKSSRWGTHVIPITKSNGDIRMCEQFQLTA